MTSSAAIQTFDPEEHKGHHDDRVTEAFDDDARAATERDLFDSPSDSWRDLELREALDELDGEPPERAEA